MTDGALHAPAHTFETAPDRDAPSRHAVAILAALLLHLGAILSLLDEFPRPSPPQPEPIPVELALAPPKPPEPVEPEPPAAQQPVPDRRSGGDLENVAPGEPPPAEPSPAVETPEVAGSPRASPQPAPTPPLPPAETPTEAPPPPPVAPAPQQTVLAPVPPTKPRSSPAPATAEVPTEREADPNAPVTMLKPGQGGGDRYLNTLRDDLLAHMFWPPTAEMFGVRGGIATYGIVIDRQGRLLEARLMRSSGLAMLDRAALQTIRLAAPFDPVPDDIVGSRIGMIVDLTIAPPP